MSLTGHLPLAKLHGSISRDLEGFYTEGRRGLSGAALIVPPSPQKQVQPALLFTWRLGRQILQSSRKLLVFGFAFNQYDQQLLHLLKLTGKEVRQILLVDPAPKPDLARLLWPEAEILCSEPPPTGAEQIARWAHDQR